MRERSSTARKKPVPAVAVVVSGYNASVTERLLDGALRAYADAGGRADDPKDPGVRVVRAPGAFELTALSLAAARRPRVRGVVALGCIIKGETRHDEYLAHAVAQGLVGVTLKTGKPVTMGVLTVRDAGQARARAGGRLGNKGAEAMSALLRTLDAADGLGRAVGAYPPAGDRPDKALARRSVRGGRR
ncbi:MAG: 6,7-dimethyl-8-ribityllumazine synthase [Phycisphaerae bacterium]|nr:6,7-dimethyl-8-ribityllumazine synthase [Phycisphaerae bacterium]